MGIGREDKYNGGQLINIYHTYVKNSTEYLYKLLILHNSDDMKGMLRLIPLLAYHDLFNGDIKVKKVQAASFPDSEGRQRQMLLMKLTFPCAIPRPISAFSNGCGFNGEGNEGILKVPVYEEEMKYFYSNYKDYYYLPAEDTAIHKSVSSFVDRTYRVQATAATCYTRKFSSYLPQWDVQIEPFSSGIIKAKNCSLN